MKTYLFPALKITVITVFIFGVLYPLLITGISKVIAPNQGEGEVVRKNGMVVGFARVGQSFDSSGYFNGRPSAVGYNAAATGGSNKGPGNPEYLIQVEARINALIKDNPGLDRKDIPIDLITASGGGLDPHISVRAAEIQVPRIAIARELPPDNIYALITRITDGPVFGLFGPSTVNVLELNLALDELK